MRFAATVAFVAATLTARVAYAQLDPGAPLRVRTDEAVQIVARVGGQPVALPMRCRDACILHVPAGRTSLAVQGPHGSFTTRVFDVPVEGARTRLRFGSHREGAAVAWFVGSAVALLGSLPFIALGSACVGNECTDGGRVAAGWTGLVLGAISLPMIALGIVAASHLGDGVEYVTPLPR